MSDNERTRGNSESRTTEQLHGDRFAITFQEVVLLLLELLVFLETCFTNNKIPLLHWLELVLVALLVEEKMIISLYPMFNFVFINKVLNKASSFQLMCCNISSGVSEEESALEYHVSRCKLGAGVNMLTSSRTKSGRLVS